MGYFPLSILKWVISHYFYKTVKISRFQLKSKTGSLL